MQPKNSYIIYGKHPCFAALANNSRKILHIYTNSKNFLPEIKTKFPQHAHLIKLMTDKEFFKLIPPGAIHQSIALATTPLTHNIYEILKQTAEKTILLILDNVTDPHNIGAVLRSAAAFQVAAVVTAIHTSPEENATIAKTSSGGLEMTPYIRVRNIADFIDELKDHGFWIIGLDGKTDNSLLETPAYQKIALVLGAEDKGLRRLTKEKCDLIAKLDINSKMESLNVSNAAAIAMFIERNIK